jgi:hypothetical protein
MADIRPDDLSRLTSNHIQAQEERRKGKEPLPQKIFKNPGDEVVVNLPKKAGDEVGPGRARQHGSAFEPGRSNLPNSTFGNPRGDNRNPQTIVEEREEWEQKHRK